MSEPRPPSDPGAPIPVAPGGALRATWQLALPMLSMALLAAILAAVLGAAALWLLRSPEGTSWLLARIPGLEVTGSEGALLSDRFAARRLVVRWDKNQQHVAIDGLVGEGLQWHWHPAPGKWIGLDVARLQARRVEVDTGPAGPRPIEMPATLDLPLRIQIEQASVDELQIDTLPAMRTVQGQRLRLWQDRDGGYEAETLALEVDRARVSGAVLLGARAPFPLRMQARIDSRGQDPAWDAEVQASGPLARFELQARLRGTSASRGAAAPALDVQATITPLQAWALGRLQLSTQALDLRALASSAPRTALSGRMDIDTQSMDGPLAASVDLENAQPGRWDEGRVPARRLHARLRSPAGDRSRLLIESFDVQFARGAENAGRWQGSGAWLNDQLQIQSTIDGLQPQRLDGRAATMELSGPLAFTVSGLPPPDPQAADAQPKIRKPRTPLAVELRSTLDGRIEGSPLPVSVVVDAQADARRLLVRSLRAQAGSAHATLELDAQRSGKDAWQMRTSGKLADFDPLPWWPGPERSAWRQGRHRISGSWALDLAMPDKVLALPPLALAQELTGRGHLNLERSQIAGVPLALALELGQEPTGGDAAGRPSTLAATLQLGENRLSVQGQGNPLGDGRDDHLQFELQASRLATLAPIVRLLPDLAEWAPQAGSAQATFSIDGRWPAVRSSGRAQLQDLRTATLQARSAGAQWGFDTRSEQPLSLELQAQDLAQQEQRIQRLLAQLRGTWRQHRLELTAVLPVQPSTALQTGLGLQAGSGALLQVGADGQWVGDGRSGGRWSARGAQIALLPWSGTGLEALSGAQPWAQARDLGLELRFDGHDGLQELRADAGRLRLADASALRWDEVHVDLSGPRAAFALRAQLEPFPLAPLLARLQPKLGWQGDLRLAGSVDLRVAETVDADIVFERRDGDLRLSEENASAPFGLSELQLIASAHQGRWQLAAAFAGRTLGEAAARLNLQTRAEQRWPDADTPIDGLVQAHVSNLGIWGNWLPPGWRLSGQLHTVARVGGRVGAPDYEGQMRASDVAVRNLLLGVDVSQGQAQLRLHGASAEIEQFTLRSGEGSARIGGHIDLSGRAPSRLTLNAERLRVLGRIDRQIVASGELTMDVVDAKPDLKGRVRIDEGLIDLSRSDAPSLDDDVVLRRASFESDRTPAAAAPSSRRNVQVAVELDLGEKLRVHGRGLDTTLGGKLLVGSRAGRLTLEGSMHTVGGQYSAYGQKLEIARGRVIFSGDVENPTLDVLALRPNIDIEVGVAITGTLTNPRVRLYSNTDLSESDKLSWLVLGRPSDGLDRADSALLQRVAVALLAGEGEAPTDTLMRTLGLDTISVHETGEGNVRETVVSLGKQLSRRWYVGYERGVNATSGSWQLIYRIAQRFTLRAQSGAENSLDLIWVWRLQGQSRDRPVAPTPAQK
ncbi:MAG: translocation/assembly module TamB domain-containing protein [Burkholderiales bacterium]|nr:translocation/assembly module TamB domain-containing protein [Burkholderiales bacterium]